MLLCCALPAGALRAGDEAQGEVALSRDVMVAMRDGVKLATDIYSPARDGQPVTDRFPAILVRTPYNKEAGAAAFARYFVARGYVVASSGRAGPLQVGRALACRSATILTTDFDTATWIGEQPWFDGNIGTTGTSYEGATQHALAIANAPYVKAMIPRNAMSDFGRYGVRHNGAFELRWFNWVFYAGECQRGLPNALPAAARAASDPAARQCAGGDWAAGPRVRARPAAASGHHAAEVRARLRSLADRGDGPRRL